MRLRRNQIVAVEFLDHVEGGSEPIRCVVYGRLARIAPDVLVIDSWEYADARKPHDDNETRFTIVRAAISRVTVLGPREA